MGRMPIQSVKFKKDYMMLLAFLLFFLIVGSECFLIVWLPWHVRLDGMWAKQVAQQELIERFDHIRIRARNAAGKLPKPAGAEAGLICRALDRAASYMHKYGKSLSPSQCKVFTEVLLKLNSQLSNISATKNFSGSVELDETVYLQKVRGMRK